MSNLLVNDFWLSYLYRYTCPLALQHVTVWCMAFLLKCTHHQWAEDVMYPKGCLCEGNIATNHVNVWNLPSRFAQSIGFAWICAHKVHRAASILVFFSFFIYIYIATDHPQTRNQSLLFFFFCTAIWTTWLKLDFVIGTSWEARRRLDVIHKSIMKSVKRQNSVQRHIMAFFLLLTSSIWFFFFFCLGKGIRSTMATNQRCVVAACKFFLLFDQKKCGFWKKETHTKKKKKS